MSRWDAMGREADEDLAYEWISNCLSEGWLNTPHDTSTTIYDVWMRVRDMVRRDWAQVKEERT